MEFINDIPKIDPNEIKEDKTPQPERTPEILEFENNIIRNRLREERNKLLLESDKYFIPDFPVTPDKLILIREYRQQLRDMPINNFIFPKPPF